jgi:hypothetical protein
VRVIEQSDHVLEAECIARAFTHRRRFELRPDSLVITDFIEGPPPLEQFWHFGVNAEWIEPGKYRLGSSAELVIPAGSAAQLESGWRSRTYGRKEAAPVLRVTLSGAGPHVTRIYFTSN